MGHVTNPAGRSHGLPPYRLERPCTAESILVECFADLPALKRDGQTDSVPCCGDRTVAMHCGACPHSRVHAAQPED